MTDFGRAWVDLMLTRFLDGGTDRLGDLDRRSGDGDFGANLTSAFGRVVTERDKAQPTDYRGQLTAVSRGFLGTGGTSGPLFGMFFRDLAQCVEDGEPDARAFAGGLAKGVATVHRYGAAEVGDKTMVDALSPAAQAMADAVEQRRDDQGCFDAAADAAIEGARSTADLTARRGRASYVGEVARGVLDPGAVAAAIVLQCAAAARRGATRVDTAWFDRTG